MGNIVKLSNTLY